MTCCSGGSGCLPVPPMAAHSELPAWEHEELLLTAGLCQLTAHMGTWHPSPPRAGARLHHCCLHCHSCRDLTAQLCSSATGTNSFQLEYPSGSSSCDTTKQIREGPAQCSLNLSCSHLHIQAHNNAHSYSCTLQSYLVAEEVEQVSSADWWITHSVFLRLTISSFNPNQWIDHRLTSQVFHILP